MIGSWLTPPLDWPSVHDEGIEVEAIIETPDGLKRISGILTVSETITADGETDRPEAMPLWTIHHKIEWFQQVDDAYVSLGQAQTYLFDDVIVWRAMGLEVKVRWVE